MFAPQEVYFTTVEERKVTLCAPTVPIANRGCTLGSINLTLIITSPMPGVIRLQMAHHLGRIHKGPEFELNMEDQVLDVKDSDDMVIITSGSLSLEITKKPWSMTYKRNGEVISKASGRDLAIMKTDWKGLAYDKGDDEDTYVRQQLSIDVGELIYGLGEHFTPFAKNGQSVEIWNADGGTSTEQSYKNIPFFVSNKGYGVLVNHPEKVEFEIGTEMVTKTEFSVPGDYLDYFLFDGPTMKDVLVKYTDLTGKPSLPAPWTFGLWLSTSFTTNYDEDTVMSFVDGMLDRGIPLRTFHFDCFWMKEFHWSDFVWDERVSQILKVFSRDLKQRDLTSVYGSTHISVRNHAFSKRDVRRVTSSSVPTAMYGSGICGSREWQLSTSPILRHGNGSRTSLKFFLIWALTASKQTLVKEFLQRTLFTMTAPIR